jgi:hypothetical protein
MTRSAPLIGLCILAACASPGVPPGGPVDTEAPQIVKIVPDSGKVGTKPKAVVFRFDEVVNERPSGAASLNALFIISPSDGEPRVDWHREEITVRPKRGWKNNTAYTITLLPGLSDLRGNTRNTSAVTIFSTGATIPAGRIAGALFNWSEGRTITRSGIVQAWPKGDTTLVYVATTDSTGGFILRNMSPGQYVVRGISDDNNNRGLDPREAWDTTSVTLQDSTAIDMYAFVHDSLGTRLQNVGLRDSVTLDLTFENPLSVRQPLTAANIRVRAPDSTDVGVLSVSLPPADTTATAHKTTPLTGAPLRPADTVAAVHKMSRAVPTRTVIVKLAHPLKVKTLYRVRVTDAKNLMGVSRNSENTINTPAAMPAVARPAGAAPPAVPPPGPVKK